MDVWWATNEGLCKEIDLKVVRLRLELAAQCAVTAEGVLYQKSSGIGHHGATIEALVTGWDYPAVLNTLTENSVRDMREDQNLEVRESMAFHASQDNYIKNRFEQALVEHGILLPGKIVMEGLFDYFGIPPGDNMKKYDKAVK